MARYYTAEEAVRRLGASRNTLYAYVSRGLIRSEPDSREKRTRRYHAQNVEHLAGRSEVHKAPENALRKATDWGAPRARFGHYHDRGRRFLLPGAIRSALG